VFSTKYSRPVIKDEVRKELHAYIVGVLSKLGSYTYELYANPDHTHILVSLPRTITIAELVSKTKTSSSKWLKHKGIPDFGWQDGYGIFSVGASSVDTIKRYILNQPHHHSEIVYKDEMRRYFSEYEIEYDERYVWD